MIIWQHEFESFSEPFYIAVGRPNERLARKYRNLEIKQQKKKEFLREE